ncbi:MAG: helix-turn-helix domain-containing protein [Pyrinomonadaceae bacterium]
MIFAHYTPRFPLSEFVEAFIYFRGIQVEHRIERLLPDGNVVLIIDLTDDPQYIYDNESLAEIQTCRRAWFSGLQQQGISIPSGNGNENFVIAFRRGRSFPFTGTPLTEFTNRVVESDLALSQDILDLREALQDLDTPPAKFAFAEAELLRRFGGGLRVNACVDYAVEQIARAPHETTIGELTGKIGYSQKHFIQLFKQEVGVTPKSYLRIMRFQKSIGEIARTPAINWAALAADCGYFDQAHMIAEFRSFAGLTPVEYQRQASVYPSYVVVA